MMILSTRFVGSRISPRYMQAYAAEEIRCIFDDI